MKLEYLPDGSPECPLIRLYEFDQPQARQLTALVKSLGAGDCQDVALQNESWVEPVRSCCLNLRVGTRNHGVRQVGPHRFECVLSLDSWRNMEGLLEPFLGSTSSGFQWLTNEGKVGLLISRNGQW